MVLLNCFCLFGEIVFIEYLICREACGVPFSCCKPKDDEIIKNKQCGYDVRKHENVSFDLYLLSSFKLV